MKFLRVILCFVLLISGISGYGQVQPASVFGDHMVLQQNMILPVWGESIPGDKITVSFNGKNKTVEAGQDCNWMVKLPAFKSGGPYTLTIKSSKNEIIFKDIYVGEVWLCSGQSNMDMTVAREDRYWCGVNNEKEEVATADYPLIRVFDTEFTPKDTPQKNVNGKWEICSPATVGHFSAAAYFFARDIYHHYNVPIGLITTAFGASTAEAWISQLALQSHPQLAYLLTDYDKKRAAYDTSFTARKKYDKDYEAWKLAADKAAAEGKDKPKEPKNPDPKRDQHNPAVLYNGMVAPLVPYAIRGALWYQGESNGPTAKLYSTLMETLIQDWRKAWGEGTFPFYYVQLANHQALITEPVKDDPMVWVREGQLKNLSIPNTGMVVAIDNADPKDVDNIHPKNKQAIGARLALIARANVYGEKITCSGPIYEKITHKNNTLRIHFNFTGKGLKAQGDSLTGFAIAGEDKKFRWANAKIDGTTVVVWDPGIAHPEFVRYGWSKNPPVNLYNQDGLPASPFRSDTETSSR